VRVGASFTSKKGSNDQISLGETRRPVVRTLAWFHQWRRLRTRYERRLDIHQAFLILVCIKTCAITLSSVLCKNRVNSDTRNL